jgi:N6-L-threonylcarbamoyladenine synthase
MSFAVSESTVILAIETSCDETAASVVMGGNDVLSSIVSSQIDIHARFGGVVPEVASRAHLESIVPVIDTAIAEAGILPTRIDAVAATAGPGLIGALLVGVSAAKSLALVWDKPFIGINHLEAHLYAGLLDDPTLEFPLVVLLVSGGHTMIIHMKGHGDYTVLGRTIDDAAGEAYDKVARYLNLGYPGGPVIDRIASEGNSHAVEFPRAMMHDGLDVSFSGLKTSVINHVRRNPEMSNVDIAASFQAAVVDVLCAKTLKAAQQVGARGIVLGGGVSANSFLRSEMSRRGAEAGFKVALPSRAMCTDNAAMDRVNLIVAHIRT